MKKAIVILLLAMFAVVGLALHDAVAQGQEKQKPVVVPTVNRWHGVIVRINTDKSTLDVRKGSLVKTIHFDSSTKWTKGTKVIDMSEFKEGSEVICIGNYESGNPVMNATRVDLRK